MTSTEDQGNHHFWHQESAQRALFAANDADRLGTAYLFVGPEGVGKWAAATWTAKALLCEHEQKPCDNCDACRRVQRGTHPDLHLLFPVPRVDADDHIASFIKIKHEDPFAVVRFDKRPNLSIERVRYVQSELSKTAVEGGKKVTIIAAADQMKSDVHGILLKSIEEPPPSTHFVLTSADAGRLPQTIHSRCQTIRFTAVDPGIIESRLIQEGISAPPEAGMVAHLSNGGWGSATQLCNDDAVAWRAEMQALWRDAFRPQATAFLDRTDSLFRGPRFNEAVQAFDFWSLLLWRDIRSSLAGRQPATSASPQFASADQAWGCWKILQQGRATLWVNVVPRSAIRGTFLALRKRLSTN